MNHLAFIVHSPCVHHSLCACICAPFTFCVRSLFTNSSPKFRSAFKHHSACIQHSFSIHSAFAYHSSGKVEVNVSGTLHTQLVSFMPSSRVNTSNTFSIYYQQNTTTSTLGVMTFTIS